MVGQTLAFRAAEVGYAVWWAHDRPSSAGLEAFAGTAGIATGSFADAAAAASLVVNATNGVALAVRPWSWSARPTSLARRCSTCRTSWCRSRVVFRGRWRRTDEQPGAAHPDAPIPQTRVVKSLNTMNCQVMADPSLVPGDHVVFLSGDDGRAKVEVAELLAAVRLAEGARSSTSEASTQPRPPR